uniref:Uncharacterized protein n=1 Tax=uncultured marine group II/III euryarchaeote KM3_15_H06 TaxID=1457911 RepID=A0A075GG44_9EURY|nr:hypothetical protein [uncultured marine group II/III euryarchaeote KM3_15_H06]
MSGRLIVQTSTTPPSGEESTTGTCSIVSGSDMRSLQFVSHFVQLRLARGGWWWKWKPVRWRGKVWKHLFFLNFRSGNEAVVQWNSQLEDASVVDSDIGRSVWMARWHFFRLVEQCQAVARL